MKYREERELVIRLKLGAEFPDDYEGEDDGYAWHRDFDERIRPALLRDLLRTLTRDRKFKVTPINRGLDAHEEIEILVEHLLPDSADDHDSQRE